MISTETCVTYAGIYLKVICAGYNLTRRFLISTNQKSTHSLLSPGKATNHRTLTFKAAENLPGIFTLSREFLQKELEVNDVITDF